MSTEIDRIAGTTTWAGASMMEASAGTSFSFQVGTATGVKNQIGITINTMSAKASRVGDIDIKYTVDPSVTTPVPVGSKFLVNTTTEGYQYILSVTALGGGGFVTTWHGDGLGDDSGVFGQRFDASGVVSGPEFLLTTTEGSQSSASVTALADGGFVATLFGKSPSDPAGISGQRYDASGVASESEFLINTTTEGDQTSPSVTALGDGDFMVTWQGKDGPDVEIDDGMGPMTISNTGIFGQRFYAGIDLAGVQVTDAASSRTTITSIDAAIQTVNIQRSELGAVSNRLDHTVNNLTNIASNLSAAKGGIEDAYFSLETTNLAKNQILPQASTAMLAQANASKQNVLSLLQG